MEEGYYTTSKKGVLTLLLGVFLTLNSFSLRAQINAFVGYAYTQNRDSKTFNHIIERYNALNPTLLQQMTSLNFLHGVDLGIRYRFPAVSFEFDWFNKFNQINDRVRNTDNTEYKNVLYYKSQSYCLGMEFYHQWFGAGASLDWNNLIIRKEKSTDRVKEDWLKQGGLSNHIFLNFEFNMNDAMALSIRPFVQLPLYKNDFYNIEAKLNPSTASTLDPTAYKQKVINWGVKFLFVNGTKSP
jgi:hypothetical protein